MAKRFDSETAVGTHEESGTHDEQGIIPMLWQCLALSYARSKVKIVARLFQRNNTYGMATRKKLAQTKQGLVDQLTKVVRDAAGELLTNVLCTLEERENGVGDTSRGVCIRSTQTRHVFQFVWLV